MQLMLQQVPAEEIMRMINNRLEAVTSSYHYARGKGDEKTAEAMAETKWQIAELKMQFADLLVKQLQESPEEITTN